MTKLERDTIDGRNLIYWNICFFGDKIITTSSTESSNYNNTRAKYGAHKKWANPYNLKKKTTFCKYAAKLQENTHVKVWSEITPLLWCSVNLLHICRTTFSKNTYGGMLLTVFLIYIFASELAPETAVCNNALFSEE